MTSVARLSQYVAIRPFARAGHRRLTIAASVALALSLLSTSTTAVARPDATTAELVEPTAGTWRTWVLDSGSQLRVPPPPDAAMTDAESQQLHALVAQRDAHALDRISFWDTGAPGYRWEGVLADELLRRNLLGATRSRHWALMEVAIYDATVAAWDSKYAYQRPRPSTLDPTLDTSVETPRSPAYPSEHAAVAAAAAGVLAYLFPDDAQAMMDMATEAAQSRELAGVQYPSDTTAGLDLGRQVAKLVIERAQRDFSAEWNGALPTEPGKWNLTRYPVGAKPVDPQFASYKPWVLSSPSELRPAPPPAFDSPERAAEVAEVVNFPRTFATNVAAFYWQSPKGTTTHWTLTAQQKIFEYRLDTNPPRAARVQALMQIAAFDSTVACWDGKFTYWVMRPFQFDASFTPLVTVPVHPSYPAAHGCYSGSQASVLSYLFPREADALTAQADEAGMARLWGGIHFPSDIRAGLGLGRAVAQRVIDEAKRDGAD